MLTRTPSRFLSKHASGRHKRMPQAADIAIGASIRIKRLALKMSQGDLGEMLGITFQQVQKYENGANRVAGSRLIQAAAALQCSVAELTGEARAADKRGFVSPMLLLLARSEPAARLMVQVQRLHGARRMTAIADLARAAEQMMRAT